MGKKCWEIRGCTQDMFENCAFGTQNIPCELPCHWAAASCKGYDIVPASELITPVDFSSVAVAKQQCFYCAVLRKHVQNNNNSGHEE